MSDATARLTAALAGRYRIERHIGAGGMATVYLAHDLKHDRKVAVKVLRPELAAVLGAGRFLNEIKVTANLQHPHILALYDSGEADGFLFYVMPHVENEPLDQRLKREKQLGIEEAVRLAGEIASALDYAHRHGVVHRDIKPANVLLQDGKALVADFGIALALKAAGGDRLTETGLSLGTPHYMSPEQATGDREVDARSDVYALGAVLYEMVAGEPPHTGNTIQAILSRVLTERPRPLTDVRHSVPVHVAMAVEKALAKTPGDRFATAAEFATALSNPAFTLPSLATTRVVPVAGPAWRRRSLANWHVVVAVSAAVVLGALVGKAFERGTPQPAPVARFSLGVQLADASFGSLVALSSDASELVYVGLPPHGGAQLYRRSLDEATAVPIAGSEGSLVTAPFFSPDGSEVGFYADQQLRVVAVHGGAARALALMSPTSGGASWGPDNRIVFQPDFGSGLWVVSAEGGDPEQLTHPDTAAGVLDHRWPEVLPDGKSVVLTIWKGSQSTAAVGVASMRTGEVHELVPGMQAHYLDAGYLVYAAPEGALRAVKFDARKGRVAGSPVTVLDSVLLIGDGSASYGLSRNGTIAFLGSLANLVPALVDRAGTVTPLAIQPGQYQAPRFAPDGRSVAFGYGNDLWIYDFALGTFGPLTSQGGFYGLWTPDSKRLFFSRTEGADVNVYSVPADRGEEPSLVFKASGQQRTQDLSPDGKALLLRRNLVTPGRAAGAESDPLAGGPGTRMGMAGGQYDLWALRLGQDTTPQPWLATPYLERSPTFSPDGAWVAYSSNESGRDEVYVRPFPGPGGRIQVSTEGGNEPAWATDGASLYYRSGTRFESVAVTTRPTFRVMSRPKTVFEGRYYAYPWQREYDVRPNGQGFVVLSYVEQESQLSVIVNWWQRVQEGWSGR